MTPPLGTSKCNPEKLGQYAADSSEMSNALEDMAQGDGPASLTQALSRLASAGGDSAFVPAMGTVAEDFADLAGDWGHLDEFAGDVAEGFRVAATIGEEPTDKVFELPDQYIGQLGQIGYADRDEAIAAAEEMAAEFERLRERGMVTEEEVLAFATLAQRGQYDPAFAVTFSEALGVDGYNQATAMIRHAYQADGEGVPPEGIAAVALLSQTLTTALDTSPGIPRDERHDPDNANLRPDERLSADFVRDLTSEYQAGPNSAFQEDERDLSVLLSMTDPPTAVAVDIADNRLTPRLVEGEVEEVWHGGWGDHGGIVTNYAEMLGRNQDAGALWLSSDHGVNWAGEPVYDSNLTLVLQRDDWRDIDGGQALARVVENGLTIRDRPEIRQSLMGEAIDVIGAQGEIRNEHMHDALARGVESNVDVIDNRVNNTFVAVDDNGHPVDPNDPYANFEHNEQWNAYTFGTVGQLEGTHVFLTELMDDPEAAARVRTATIDYVQENLGALPVGEDGLPPRGEVHELGRTLGVVTEADVSNVEADIQQLEDAEATEGALVDWAASWIPGVGQVNDGTAALIDTSVGDLAEDSVDRSELRNIAREAQATIEGFGVPGFAEDALSAAGDDVEMALAD
jgi:hypothetical protein